MRGAVGHPITVGVLSVAAATLIWWTAHLGSPVAGLIAALAVPALVGRSGSQARGLAAAGAVGVATAVVAVAGIGDTSIDALEIAALYAGLALSAVLGARWGELLAQSDAREGALTSSRAELVRNVSHELRTPLTVIQGLLTTLFQHWDTLDEPAKLDLIDSASSNVASLDSSILHFIDAGRIERGEVDVQAEQVDMAELVSEVESKLEMVVAGYQLRTDLHVEVWNTDKTSLSRIVELFVENAARFSPLGSTITISTREREGAMEVAVSDQGKGIPPTLREHVFEPFWRADVQETGVSRGAGLGLYVAKRLAEQLGGEVGHGSVKGRGSRFFAVIPVWGQPATPPEGRRSRR